MEISEVKVFPIQEEKLKAFVSIVFDQCFMVNDIKIIQGRDGLFISMPSRKKKNGEFKDVAHPLNNETRRMIEDKVLGEYERVLGERGERLPAPPHHASAPAAAVPSSASSPAAANPLAAAPLASTPSAASAASAPTAPTAGITGTIGPAGDGPSHGAGGGVFPSLVVPSGPVAGGDPSGAAGAPAASPKAPEKTLEEIEEMHLRDSFWTVT
jgi:stage V sporulation protein G